MGTAWVLAAMAAALGAFLFGRERAAPRPRDEADELPHDLLEGLAPGSLDDADDTRPSVAGHPRQERRSWPRSGANS
jgi:hypothetical protein